MECCVAITILQVQINSEANQSLHDPSVALENC